MRKFVKGDKVRYLSDGEIAEVVEDEGPDGRFKVMTEEYGVCTETRRNVELYATSDEPFITIIPPQPAKRVLKDHQFHTKNRAFVKMIAEGRTVSLDTANYSFEATDIAELITFLTKVHEVLKENEDAV